MELIGGIASSTHVDLHGQIIDRHLLEEFVETIKTNYMPLRILHISDSLAGVVLDGRVIELPDGEYALIAVSGMYESDKEAEAFAAGAQNTTWRDYEPILDEIERQVLASDLPGHADVESIEEGFDGITKRLGIYMSSTQISPDGEILLTKRQVAAFGDLKVEVYPKDHEPPHFHVRSAQRDFEARFSVETLDFLSNKRGRISNGDIRAVKQYFTDNPDDLDKLRAEYRRLNDD
jgi:hypothetical protein